MPDARYSAGRRFFGFAGNEFAGKMGGEVLGGVWVVQEERKRCNFLVNF
jgi:hypothetical protein